MSLNPKALKQVIDLAHKHAFKVEVVEINPDWEQYSFFNTHNIEIYAIIYSNEIEVRNDYAGITYIPTVKFLLDLLLLAEDYNKGTER